jgi:hypothetical protein
VNLWEVFLAALGGGLAGAAAGGVAGAWATYHERLRGNRASLYAQYLIPFHDEVDTRRIQSAERNDLTTTGGPDPNLQVMFRGLDIAATTASGFDSRAVRAIREQLEQIESASKPYHERGDIPAEDANKLAQDAVDSKGTALDGTKRLPLALPPVDRMEAH